MDVSFSYFSYFSYFSFFFFFWCRIRKNFFKNDFFCDFQNDGSFKGRRYFTCPKDKGIFVIQTKILRKFGRGTSYRGSKESVDDDDDDVVVAETLMGKPKVIKIDVKKLQTDPDLRQSSPATQVFAQSLFTKKYFIFFVFFFDILHIFQKKVEKIQNV